MNEVTVENEDFEEIREIADQQVYLEMTAREVSQDRSELLAHLAKKEIKDRWVQLDYKDLLVQLEDQ